ncbi:MAG: Rieske 2Fe-2S domain-containing protein [Burkholderiaceae bacterium]
MPPADRDNPLLRLSATGPDTPAGALFRRYWLPVLLADELPEPNCAPLRVTLLGEALIAFRDSAGRLGLVDEYCAHRGASLWFARNEDHGLRCAYHGWKYDTSGQCTEIPSEPEHSSVRDRIRLKSYPLIERGGILWAYLGPPQHQPAPPAFEFVQVPAAQRYASKRLQECNYLQALDGGMDPFHLAFLHRGEFAGVRRLASDGVRRFMKPELNLRMASARSEGGLQLANGRQSEAGIFWRVMQWIMPCFTLIPPFGEHPVHGHAWVPIDDERCWVWTFEYHPTRALAPDELSDARAGGGLHVPVLPGSFLPAANRGNDYLMDRSKQKSGIHYSGVPGIGNQDAALQENMSPVARRVEHLVSIDQFIVQARRRLTEAVQRVSDGDEGPLPGTTAAAQQVRSASALLTEDVDVFEAVRPATQMESGAAFLSV